MTPPPNDTVVVTNPDPTEAVKEALTLGLSNLDTKLEERFKASEAAIVLARSELKDQLITMDSRINDKFIANEKLVDQLGRANSTALTAALQTQEKGQAQLKQSFDEANKATNEKIDRLTSRLDLGEGRIGGAVDNRQITRQDVHDSREGADSTRKLIFALIGVVLVATGIIVSVMLRK